MIYRKVKLITFIKGSSDPAARMVGCASYKDGGCIFDKPCDVENGRPCKYFERAVLPTAADIGQLHDLVAEYEKISKRKIFIKQKELRLCPDCQTTLLPRARFCPDCAKKHRKAAYYAMNKKRPLKGGRDTTVNQKNSPENAVIDSKNRGDFEGQGNRPHPQSART